MVVRFELPRKTNLAYFSLVAMRKAGYLEWHEKMGRKYTIQKENIAIKQAREPDIINNVMDGLSDIGISRQSYFADVSGYWPEVGSEYQNIRVVGELEFCNNLIVPLGLRKSVQSDDTIIIQPHLKNLINEFYPQLKGYKIREMYSVPSGLNTGMGFMGLGRVFPLTEKNFDGDVGEDGWPYDRLKKYNTYAFSKLRPNGKEFELTLINDLPIVVKNIKNSDKEVDQSIKEFLTTSKRIGNIVDYYDYVKENGKYVSKLMRSRSLDKDINFELYHEFRQNTLVYREKKSRLLDDKFAKVIYYKTEPINLGTEIPNVEIKILKNNNSLVKEITNAVKSGIDYIMICGQREKENKTITVKDIKKKKQENVPLSDLGEILFKSEDIGEVVLVQEPGTLGNERRLNIPGEQYFKEHPELIRVYSNYKDMGRMILENYAKVGILGYNNLIEFLAGQIDMKSVPSIENFNKFASENSIPLEISRVGGSQCYVALAIPEGKDAIMTGDTIATEYENIVKRLICENIESIKIRKINGAAETYEFPIVDVVSSGETLKRNKKFLAEKLFESDAVVVRRI